MGKKKYKPRVMITKRSAIIVIAYNSNDWLILKSFGFQDLGEL